MEANRSWKDKLFLNKTVKAKCREFHENGYPSVQELDMWEYLITYRWVRNDDLALSEKKQDVSNVTFNDFFDFQRIKAQTRDVKRFDWNDIQDLL
ncbi:post-transcriptional regulator [uncultured Vagococcus sp.]|uniref:post-transcriptional regulator n=1 Tax=uncultured Vagococcus sp. TaxID=189676 RepID=UPI0028D51E24|nr:post-transcriptional regulator [uncultured Vagococcus sp.]